MLKYILSLIFIGLPQTPRISMTLLLQTSHDPSGHQVGNVEYRRDLKSGRRYGYFWQTTQPVSLAAIPLATDAATLSEQQTQTTKLYECRQ